MKFSIKVFFSKCNQIGRKLRIWSQLLKKFLIENFIFCAVIFLDGKLDFDDHIKGVFDETSMVLFTSSEILPKPSLLQIYKSFVRPYLDYDIICDKAFLGFFQQKLESIQYSAEQYFFSKS